jgi:hypothetical protein
MPRACVEGQSLQGPAAVVGAIVDIDNFQSGIEQRNGRQDAIPVQPTRVQVVGLEVGGGDKADTILEQRRQQPVQNHRVGDVCHMELVKADQTNRLAMRLASSSSGLTVPCRSASSRCTSRMNS